MNLKRCGKLNALEGLIVGGFTDMRDNEVSFGKMAETIIRDRVADYDFPVCFKFPAGHIKDNRALIMGSKVQLDASGDSCVLRFE